MAHTAHRGRGYARNEIYLAALMPIRNPAGPASPISYVHSEFHSSASLEKAYFPNTCRDSFRSKDVLTKAE